MDKKRKSVLYISDSEESIYSEAENQPVEDEPVVTNDQCSTTDQQEETPPKIKGVRRRDLVGKRSKSFQCSHCGRPYNVAAAHAKHEAICPRKLEKDAAWAAQIAETQKDLVTKAKQKQDRLAKKQLLEAARPVEIIHKKRGPKPKPKQVIVYESDTDVSDSEPEEPVIIRKPQKPIRTQTIAAPIPVRPLIKF